MRGRSRPSTSTRKNSTQKVRVWGDTAVVTALLWIKGTSEGKDLGPQAVVQRYVHPDAEGLEIRVRTSVDRLAAKYEVAELAPPVTTLFTPLRETVRRLLRLPPSDWAGPDWASEAVRLAAPIQADNRYDVVWLGPASHDAQSRLRALERRGHRVRREAGEVSGPVATVVALEDPDWIPVAEGLRDEMGWLVVQLSDVSSLTDDGFAEKLAGAFPLISIVIVTFNNRDVNRLCLESLFARTEWPRLEIFVVDNGSTDGTPELLAELASVHPNLRVIALRREPRLPGGVQRRPRARGRRSARSPEQRHRADAGLVDGAPPPPRAEPRAGDGRARSPTRSPTRPESTSATRTSAQLPAWAAAVGPRPRRRDLRDPDARVLLRRAAPRGVRGRRAARRALRPGALRGRRLQPPRARRRAGRSAARGTRSCTTGRTPRFDDSARTPTSRCTKRTGKKYDAKWGGGRGHAGRSPTGLPRVAGSVASTVRTAARRPRRRLADAEERRRRRRPTSAVSRMKLGVIAPERGRSRSSAASRLHAAPRIPGAPPSSLSIRSDLARRTAPAATRGPSARRTPSAPRKLSAAARARGRRKPCAPTPPSREGVAPTRPLGSARSTPR